MSAAIRATAGCPREIRPLLLLLLSHGGQVGYEKAARLELLEQCGGVGEEDRVHADGASGVHVAGVVIDEEDAVDRLLEPTGEDLKDLPLGLGDTFRAGDDDVVEEIENLRKRLVPVLDRLG